MVSVKTCDVPDAPLFASAENPDLDGLLKAEEYLVTAY